MFQVGTSISEKKLKRRKNCQIGSISDDANRNLSALDKFLDNGRLPVFFQGIRNLTVETLLSRNNTIEMDTNTGFLPNRLHDQRKLQLTFQFFGAASKNLVARNRDSVPLHH